MTAPQVRSSRKCLCQDCLRELPGFFNANDEAFCSHCGGELCDCSGCMETLSLLKQGFRDAETLGLRSDLSSWSQAGGAA